MKQKAILEPFFEVKTKEEKEVPVPRYKPTPKKIDSKQVIPKPKAEQEVTAVRNEGDHIEKTMSDNRLSDDQLAESREPSFIETLKVKQETLQKIDETPNTYREQESAILQQAETGANEFLLSQLTHMNKVQQKTGKQSLNHKKKLKKKR